MKKLFMLALAVVFSLGVSSLSFAQSSTGTTEKKADDKMEMKKGEKMEKKADKKMDKKMDKKAKMDKKDAANPCAAKAAEKK